MSSHPSGGAKDAETHWVGWQHLFKTHKGNGSLLKSVVSKVKPNMLSAAGLIAPSGAAATPNLSSPPLYFDVMSNEGQLKLLSKSDNANALVHINLG